MLVNTLIVGGGPAGVAPLIAASRSGVLERILADGVAIVERGQVLGVGRIGRYAINSDSTAQTLVSCVIDNPHPVLATLRHHPVVKAVASHGARSVPLTLVSEFMAVLGNAVSDILAAGGNPVLLEHEALDCTQDRGGLWRTRLRRVSDSAELLVLSRCVVLATGGHQPLSCLESRYVAGRPLLPTYAEKLVQSDDALTAAGLDAIAERLAASTSKRIAIIGSSSSAMACASAVLQTTFGREFGAGAVTLLHRRPLRIFYPSATEAAADGYDEFSSADICPISGFVFRLSGLRLEARELLMAVRGIGGRKPEQRLNLRQVGAALDPVASRILDEAAVIIAALGYRPRALPIFTRSGHPFALQGDGPGAPPMVDSECRVLDRHGVPIDGLLGIGLASGFFSRELVGGELSFSGQTNSLWQWQNAVGALIARRIQATDLTKPAKAKAIAATLEVSPLQSI